MNILICDDELLAVKRLERLVNELGHHVVATAHQGNDVIKLVKTHCPDVILLDIEMPEMTGLECAKRLTELELAYKPAVIFCTAYDGHALAAFQTHADGYLLKPIAKHELKQKLEHLAKLNQVQMNSLKQQEHQKQRQHIMAKSHRGMELVPVENIHYFLADQKYITVRHEEGRILIDETLKELEQEFGDTFVRIHRNALVSLRHLAGLENLGVGQQVRLRDTNERLMVSRRHLAQLRERLQTFS